MLILATGKHNGKGSNNDHVCFTHILCALQRTCKKALVHGGSVL